MNKEHSEQLQAWVQHTPFFILNHFSVAKPTVWRQHPRATSKSAAPPAVLLYDPINHP